MLKVVLKMSNNDCNKSWQNFERIKHSFSKLCIQNLILWSLLTLLSCKTKQPHVLNFILAETITQNEPVANKISILNWIRKKGSLNSWWGTTPLDRVTLHSSLLGHKQMKVIVRCRKIEEVLIKVWKIQEWSNNGPKMVLKGLNCPKSRLDGPIWISLDILINKIKGMVRKLMNATITICVLWEIIPPLEAFI